MQTAGPQLGGGRAPSDIISAAVKLIGSQFKGFFFPLSLQTDGRKLRACTCSLHWFGQNFFSLFLYFVPQIYLLAAKKKKWQAKVLEGWWRETSASVRDATKSSVVNVQGRLPVCHCCQKDSSRLWGLMGIKINSHVFWLKDVRFLFLQNCSVQHPPFISCSLVCFLERRVLLSARSSFVFFISAGIFSSVFSSQPQNSQKNTSPPLSVSFFVKRLMLERVRL